MAVQEENPYIDGEVNYDFKSSAFSYSFKSDSEYLQGKLEKEREERQVIEQEIQKLRN